MAPPTINPEAHHIISTSWEQIKSLKMSLKVAVDDRMSFSSALSTGRHCCWPWWTWSVGGSRRGASQNQSRVALCCCRLTRTRHWRQQCNAAGERPPRLRDSSWKWKQEQNEILLQMSEILDRPIIGQLYSDYLMRVLGLLREKANEIMKTKSLPGILHSSAVRAMLSRGKRS